MLMGSLQLDWIAVVTSDDKQFFKELGGRIAQLRKAHNLTQVQLAEQLQISQQTLAHYEVGRLRVPASMLPVLAQMFGVSVDALLGAESKRGAKRGPAPKLQRHLERINQLPKPKQRAVLEVLEAVLAQAGR
jgi:transcriptional regulator with XRE-family HTH domain